MLFLGIQNLLRRLGRARNKTKIIHNLAQKPQQILVLLEISFNPSIPAPTAPLGTHRAKETQNRRFIFIFFSWKKKSKSPPKDRRGKNQWNNKFSPASPRHLSKGMEFQPFLVLQELWESPGAPRDFLAAFFLLFFLKAESKICVFGIFLAFFLLFFLPPRDPELLPVEAADPGRGFGVTLQILGGFGGKISPLEGKFKPSRSPQVTPELQGKQHPDISLYFLHRF